MTDRIPPSHPFRNAIASLTPYYGQVSDWYGAACRVAEFHGFQLANPSHLADWYHPSNPKDNTDYLHVYRGDAGEPLARIRVTTHRMESGRREILSYVC